MENDWYTFLDGVFMSCASPIIDPQGEEDDLDPWMKRNGYRGSTDYDFGESGVSSYDAKFFIGSDHIIADVWSVNERVGFVVLRSKFDAIALSRYFDGVELARLALAFGRDLERHSSKFEKHEICLEHCLVRLISNLWRRS